MKNLMRLGMMALLIATLSCNETANKELAADNMEIENEMIVENDSTDCYHTQKVVGSTYYFWTQSWVDAEKKLNSAYTDSTSPSIEFSFSDIEKLMGNDTINSGIMLYYVAPTGNDRIPSLGMVKTVNCNYKPSDGGDCDEPPCWLFAPNYVTDSNVDYGFKNMRDLDLWKANWDTIQANISYPHVPVQAYNYPYSTIKSIINEEANIGSLLNVQYGLRTIGPGEDVEFYPPQALRNPDGSRKDYTGYPVLVNILLEYLEGDGGESTGQIADFDFARPCPTYCGDD